MAVSIKKFNIHWDIVALSVILFPILCENILSTIFGGALSNICSATSCILLLIYIFRQRRLKKPSPFIIIVFALIVLHCLVSFISLMASVTTSADASPTANSLISPFGLIAYFIFFLFIESNLSSRKKLQKFFLAATIATTIGVILNFIFTGDLHFANNLAVFDEAIRTGYTNSRQWLFGHRNLIFIHHLMWLLFTYLCFAITKRSYTKIFIAQIAFTLLVGVVSWNSTMMLTTAIIFILGILRNNLLKKINIIIYIVLYLVLEIGFVFLRLQDVFSVLIVNILHRNLSFTGRTAIWNYYINQYANSSVANKLLGNFGKTEIVANSHNMGLGLLAFTGITGVMMYVSLVYFSAKTLWQERKTDLARFISIIIFGFLVNSLTMEFYLQPLLAIYLGYRADIFNKFILKGEKNVKK